ncbi:MbnP family protein [Verrucomicrobiaceae bacterium 227]
MRFFILIALTLTKLSAGTLRIEVNHQFDGKPLTLGSLKYEGSETFSITRLSYLLSNFAIQKEEGTWQELPDQFAWLDAKSRRTTFTLSDVPPGTYKSLRFSVGVPKDMNHGDPAKLAADSPLNPNLNNLHWDWAGGYIFLALEGRYRAPDKELKGFVYHLANDNNLSRIQLATGFRIKSATAIALSFDLKNLLSHPRPLSFEKDGSSTHSHPGDAIASALIANLPGSFAVRGVSYPPAEVPLEAITPLYLPAKFTPFPFKMSRRFPMPALPRDNPLLTERVALGEILFHDTGLSRDGTLSCASCHDSTKAFTDGRAVSLGVADRQGTRNSMPLFNLAWKSSFFWDGRAPSLREQVLQPIQDHAEMDSNLDDVIARLGKSQRPAFEKAFGPGEATTEKLALALENFLLTLTSYDSKFDRTMAGKEKLSAEEERGMELFFTEYEPRSQQYGADCFHCHGGANFSDHQFHNNGLDDPGTFSTPSLRNLVLTAPYMHDGRFETLEEVIAHYSGPMHRSAELDPNLAKHPKSGLQLSEEDQAALVGYLKTLTDPKYQLPTSEKSR